MTQASMIRTALQPRWLGALLLAVVFAAVCGRLGAWQLEESRAEARAEAIERAAALPVAPLTEVLAPQSAFPPDGSTRRITATGTYASQDQVLIADRRLDGQPGYWVLTPLVVPDTGAHLPVLRGFVSDPTEAPAPPAGEVALAGGLAPGESPTSEAGLPEGVYRSIDLSLLVNTWDTEVYNAFVFATDEQVGGRPVESGGLSRVPPPTGASSELNLKNAMYAVQWWVFAAFGFFLWWRAVRQAHRERLEDGATAHPTDPTDRAAAERAAADQAAAAQPTAHPTDQPTTDQATTDQAGADDADAAHTLSTSTPTSRST